MKMRTKVIIGIIAIVLLGFFFVQSRSKSNTKETITMVKPYSGDIRLTISSPGTVLPKNRLEIKPPVNGRIDQVLVKEGQKVKAGEVLAWMSSTDRAALLDAARGQGDQALSYWQDAYKAIPLSAPIDGEIIVGTIQPGQTISTAENVVVISDRLIVRAQVDETDVGKVRIGQSATVTLDAYPDVRIKSKVDHIYYESKTTNNVTVYEVDLDLQEVPDFFRSGMNTNVEFTVESKDNVLLIPLEAIERRRDKAYVSIREGRKEFEEREIKLGIMDDKNAEVIDGLSTSDEVVIKSKKYSLSSKSAGKNPFMPNRSGNTRRER